MGRELRFKGASDRVIGLSLTMIGYLLWVEYRFASGLNLESGFVARTVEGIERSFLEQITTNDIGGGLIGAVFYSGTHFLLSEIGSAILAIVLMTVGLVILFGIPFDEVLSKTGLAILWITQRLIEGIRALTRGVLDWWEQLDFTISKPDVKRTPMERKPPEDGATKQSVKSERTRVEPTTEEPVVDGTCGIEHPRNLRLRFQPITNEIRGNLRIRKSNQPLTRKWDLKARIS